MSKFIRATLAAVALLVAPAAAFAQTYPTRQITIIVPFPPGAVSDTSARLVGDAIGTDLGVSVIIDNRPGAGGTNGSNQVVKATPDGYTLLVGPNAVATMNMYMQKNFPYDGPTSLEPIAIFGESQIYLVANPNLPIKTVADLIDYAKNNPGKLAFGSAGVGSGHHIAGEMLKQYAHIDMVHVPYRGAAAAVQDVIAGQIPIAFATAPVVLPHVQAGTLRVIAAAETKRSADLPDVPTIAETVPGVYTKTWVALWAPAGTPRPIVDRLYQSVKVALKKPELLAKLKTAGITPLDIGPDEAPGFIKAEKDFWGTVIPKLGIEPE